MKSQTIIIPKSLSNLSKISAHELVENLGVETYRDVIVDICMGRNVRNFTEILTRTRLLQSNIALWDFFCANKRAGISPLELVGLAKNKLLQRGIPVKEKAVYQWLIGMTEKQTQNVLRDKLDSGSLDELTQTTARILNEHSTDSNFSIEQNGIIFSAEELYWILMVVGSQTLTIRGSEKSVHGKYFEKLILGSVFQMLGLKLMKVNDINGNGFWLSSQNESSRESDATLVHNNLGIRVDIGFIGRGNTEISLDKVSRYTKFDEIAGKKHAMSTIVIVDRIGDRSKITTLAKVIEGQILQMSDSAWVIKLASLISQRFNTVNLLENIKSPTELEDWLRYKIKDVNLEELINLSVKALVSEASSTSVR